MPSVEPFATAKVPLAMGSFQFRVFRSHEEEQVVEHAAIFQGSFSPEIPVFVRVHSECLTGEVFGSLRCDCKSQLDLALAKIQKLGSGVVVYMRSHEGRGIGLGNKLRAYELQEQGRDTVEANAELGFANDLRSFAAAAEILQALNIKRVILNTNNPDKAQQLADAGIEVVEKVPSIGPLNEFNRTYLQTKHTKLGHELGAVFSKETREI